MVVDADGDELASRGEAMWEEFLTNPIIETYVWRVISEDERADHGGAADAEAADDA